jgi:uncharacterized membrane protein
MGHVKGIAIAALALGLMASTAMAGPSRVTYKTYGFAFSGGSTTDQNSAAREAGTGYFTVSSNGTITAGNVYCDKADPYDNYGYLGGISSSGNFTGTISAGGNGQGQMVWNFVTEGDEFCNSYEGPVTFTISVVNSGNQIQFALMPNNSSGDATIWNNARGDAYLVNTTTGNPH